MARSSARTTPRGRAEVAQLYMSIASLPLAASSFLLPSLYLRGSVYAEIYPYWYPPLLVPPALLLASSLLLIALSAAHMAGAAPGSRRGKAGGRLGVAIRYSLYLSLIAVSWAVAATVMLRRYLTLGPISVSFVNEYVFYPSVRVSIGPSIFTTVVGGSLLAVAAVWRLGVLSRLVSTLIEAEALARARFGVDLETLRRRFPGIAEAVEAYARFAKGHGSSSVSYLVARDRDHAKVRRIAERESLRRYGRTLGELERERPAIARALLEAARYLPEEDAQ